jgi:transposase-like protein
MKRNQNLTEHVKRKIVIEVLSGKITKEEARRIYGIKSKSGVLDWMRKFAGLPSKMAGIDPSPILKKMDVPSNENSKLKERIKQLEEELEITRLKGKAYQIMVEIAKQEYGIDLEKKPGAKQSKDSK